MIVVRLVLMIGRRRSAPPRAAASLIVRPLRRCSFIVSTITMASFTTIPISETMHRGEREGHAEQIETGERADHGHRNSQHDDEGLAERAEQANLPIS